jgi:uncharacterized protein (DUF924 family)
MKLHTTPAAVLQFWFGSDDAVDPRWFKGGPAFDELIRAEHGATVQAALAGELDHWASQTSGADDALALVIVLDQFTRNLFRGTPQAFAGDAHALKLAQGLVSGGASGASGVSGSHLQLGLLQRWFAYLPFEHAEDRAQQAEAMRLFTALRDDALGTVHEATMAGAWGYARAHADVVDTYGRFPHRNPILGRASSAAELAYLAQPGAGF